MQEDGKDGLGNYEDFMKTVLRLKDYSELNIFTLWGVKYHE